MEISQARLEEMRRGVLDALIRSGRVSSQADLIRKINAPGIHNLGVIVAAMPSRHMSLRVLAEACGKFPGVPADLLLFTNPNDWDNPSLTFVHLVAAYEHPHWRDGARVEGPVKWRMEIWASRSVGPLGSRLIFRLFLGTEIVSEMTLRIGVNATDGDLWEPDRCVNMGEHEIILEGRRLRPDGIGIDHREDGLTAAAFNLEIVDVPDFPLPWFVLNWDPITVSDGVVLA